MKVVITIAGRASWQPDAEEEQSIREALAAADGTIWDVLDSRASDVDKDLVVTITEDSGAVLWKNR